MSVSSHNIEIFISKAARACWRFEMNCCCSILRNEEWRVVILQMTSGSYKKKVSTLLDESFGLHLAGVSAALSSLYIK